MAFSGYQNLELLHHNANRRFPLVVDATAVSINSVFTIPNSLLVDMSIDLPWDRDVDPTDFYISAVYNLPEKIQVDISYSQTNSVIGSFSIRRDGFQEYTPVRLVPTSSWSDAVGNATFGQLPSDNNTPVGSFLFDITATRIELQCIRPSASSGLAGIQVVNGSLTSPIATGVVRLRTLRNMRARVEQVSPGIYDLWLDAISGIGLEQQCDCETPLSPPIRSIQGIPPDNLGNFELLGSKCLDFAYTTGGLSISNPCSEPCCTCEEAEALTDALEPFGSQMESIQGQLNRLEEAVNQMQLLLDLSDLSDRCESSGDPPANNTTTTSA